MARGRGPIAPTAWKPMGLGVEAGEKRGSGRMMRRVGRLLQHVGFWGSVLLFALVVACWVRAHYVYDLVWANRGVYVGGMSSNERLFLGCQGNRVCLSWERTPSRTEVAGYTGPWAVSHTRPPAGKVADILIAVLSGDSTDWGPVAGFFGFAHGHGTLIGAVSFEKWEFPFWLPAVLAVGMAGLFFRPIWKRRKLGRRRVAGLCASCGYDLRAHRAGEKCPECGAVVGGDAAGSAVGRAPG